MKLLTRGCVMFSAILLFGSCYVQESQALGRHGGSWGNHSYHGGSCGSAGSWSGRRHHHRRHTHSHCKPTCNNYVSHSSYGSYGGYAQPAMGSTHGQGWGYSQSARPNSNSMMAAPIPPAPPESPQSRQAQSRQAQSQPAQSRQAQSQQASQSRSSQATQSQSQSQPTQSSIDSRTPSAGDSQQGSNPPPPPQPRTVDNENSDTNEAL